MIKNSGKGNGQDGSCVRDDKADVLALHVVIDVFCVACTSQDRGAGPGCLYRNAVQIPPGLSADSLPHCAKNCNACWPGCGLCTGKGNVLLMLVSWIGSVCAADRLLGRRIDRQTDTCWDRAAGWTICISCIVNNQSLKPAHNIDGMRPE